MNLRGRTWRRLRSSEDGFTLIEVLVSILILVFVISAASALLAEGNQSSVAGERQAELISVADQQIEAIREEVKTKGYAALAMNAAPATGTNTYLPYSCTAFSGSTCSGTYTTHADPNDFAVARSGCGGSGEEYYIEANYDNTAEGQPEDPANTSVSGVTPWSGCDSGAEPLEIISSASLAFVTPQQTGVAVGADTATVDTYVTDTYVPCATGGTATCPTLSAGTVQSSTCAFPSVSSPSSTVCADARRVIVAVVLNNHGRYDTGPSSPVYVSTVFTNPTPTNDAPTNSSLGLTLGAQLG